jgi:hypothetical protein
MGDRQPFGDPSDWAETPSRVSSQQVDLGGWDATGGRRPFQKAPRKASGGCQTPNLANGARKFQSNSLSCMSALLSNRNRTFKVC